MTVEVLDRSVSRAQRLKQATYALHDTLDRSMMMAKPFRDPERYADFVALQYRFMAAVEPIYLATHLSPHFTDLASRSRLVAVGQDLADLGRPLPPIEPVAIAPDEAVGWLYVSEGSTLGAAFLLKWALELGFNETRGARHLAGAPDGRARHWRQFTAELDALSLSPAEDECAVRGARNAFLLVQAMVDARQ